MLLPRRDKLKKRAIDALRNPDLVALTSLDPSNDGKYLPLEVRINDAAHPISIELQRRGDSLAFTVVNGAVYKGFLKPVKAEGEPDTLGVDLVRYNGQRVVGQEKKGRQIPGYGTGKSFTRLDRDELAVPNYWLPTVIRHLADNVGAFLAVMAEQEEQIVADRTRNGNTYTLEAPERGTHASPASHFRRPYERNLEIDGRAVTVGVTGTYVNVDWNEFETADVIASLEDTAGHIKPDHFRRSILPGIVRAGHDRDAVMQTYEAARRTID